MSMITVSKAIPVSAPSSFEVLFLTKMIPSWPTAEGLRFGGDTDQMDVTHRFGRWVLQQMVEDMETRPSDITTKLKPFLEGKLANGAYDIELDELNELGLDIEHFLQSLCQRFPDDVDFFEVAWAYTDRGFQHGNFWGGAYFITADAIHETTTHGFLEEKRAAYMAKSSMDDQSELRGPAR